VHFHDDGKGQQVADGCLHIESVTAQSIDGVHVHAVALADVGQQLREAGMLGSRDRAGPALVDELLREVAAQRVALRLDGLCGHRARQRAWEARQGDGNAGVNGRVEGRPRGRERRPTSSLLGFCGNPEPIGATDESG
jgi:hypothetical protein